MDVPTLRRLLYDFFKFNTKDFLVQATNTGYSVSAIKGTGGQQGPKLFELIKAKSDDEGSPRVRVVESTLAGGLPDGFEPGDKPPYLLNVSDGDSIWGVISVDVTGELPGDVLSRALEAGATMPDDDIYGGIYYVKIGTVAISDAGKVTPVNVRYGPIDGTPYRMWFSNPKAFGFAWEGSPA